MKPLVGLRVSVGSGARPVALVGRWLEDLGATLVADGAADVALGETGADAPVRCSFPAEGDDVAISELTGLYDRPVGPARSHPLAIPGVVAAGYGATAIAAALFDGLRGGGARSVAVPMVDAALSAHELTVLLTDRPPPGWEPVRWAASPFVSSYRCSDGAWVFVHAGLPSHLRRLAAHPALRGALDPILSDTTRADPLRVGGWGEAWRARRALAGVFASRSAAEWEGLLGGDGLCVVRCRTAESWAGEVQPRADGQTADGVPIRLSGSEAALQPWRATRSGAAVGAPLHGVRVVDLTQVIAGPVAGRTLAALGADVVKVVDPSRQQGWVEAFRSVFDAGKRVVALDLRTEAGRRELAEHLRGADLVVHGFRPQAAARLGVSDEALRTVEPRLVVATVSAYGAVGPWAGRPGWEQTAQAVVGTQLDYGGGRPDLVPVPATDLCTGLNTAFGAVIGLCARARGAERVRVDTCLTTAAVQLRAAGAPAGHRPTRVGRPGILRIRPELVRRAPRPGLGSVTEVGLPWVGEGLTRFPEPGPGAVPGAPRAAAGLGATLGWALVLLAGRLG